MIEVTAGLLGAMTTSFKTAFKEGLALAAPLYPRIALVIPSATSDEVFPFSDDFGLLKEWIGSRKAKDLKVRDFMIKNLHFEGTIRVNRDRIEDDQYGVFAVQAKVLGESAARHPDKLVFDLLTGTDNGFDGVTFFNTAHPDLGDAGAGAQSNTGAIALSATAYGDGRKFMAKFKSYSNEPLEISPSVLMIGPGLEKTALEILAAQTVGGGNTNVYRESAELIIARRVTSDTAWYLLDLTKATRPFIVLQRKSPNLVSLTAETDHNVFDRNEYVWGIDYRGNAGYGFWQTAYRGNS